MKKSNALDRASKTRRFFCVLEVDCGDTLRARFIVCVLVIGDETAEKLFDRFVDLGLRVSGERLSTRCLFCVLDDEGVRPRFFVCLLEAY